MQSSINKLRLDILLIMFILICEVNIQNNLKVTTLSELAVKTRMNVSTAKDCFPPTTLQNIFQMIFKPRNWIESYLR